MYSFSFTMVFFPLGFPLQGFNEAIRKNLKIHKNTILFSSLVRITTWNNEVHILSPSFILFLFSLILQQKWYIDRAVGYTFLLITKFCISIVRWCIAQKKKNIILYCDNQNISSIPLCLIRKTNTNTKNKKRTLFLFNPCRY